MPHDGPAARRQPQRHTGFRDDIQGMRALAVLAIIAFHAGISPYAGGFVTLDVFFVISGFLITQLLMREVNRTGSLSLYDFYRRRAFRILPAAAVAAVGTVVGTWLWLGLVAVEDAAYDAVWAAFFAANIRFAMEETDYFSYGEAPSPFQHFWSLSVEEQFYAGLPLLLLGCVLLSKPGSKAGRLRRRAGRLAGTPSRTAFLAVAGITAVSLAWSVHASAASPESAYFSTFARIWEFGVGALLALAAPRIAGPLTARARNLLAGGGLAAITVSCFVVTPAMPFPGSIALLPVLGTGAVVLAGAEIGNRPTPVMQRALGIGPLRLIGDASYSLYLWHWPVLIIATQHLGRDLDATELLAALAFVFTIALASYRYVETPFRRGTPLRLRHDLALYPIAVAVVVSYSLAALMLVHLHAGQGSAAITTQDYQQALDGNRLHSEPVVALVQASARAAADDKEIPADLQPPILDLSSDVADLGDCEYDEPPWQLCRRGETSADRTIVVLGDSHGRHWIPAFEKIAESTDHAAYYLVKPRCTPARVVAVRNDLDRPSAECEDFNAWAQQQVEALDPDLAVISTNVPHRVLTDDGVTGDTDVVIDRFESGIGELIDDVSPHSGEVVVLGDVPQRHDEPGECLSRRDARLGDCSDRPRQYDSRGAAATKRAALDRDVRFIGTNQWFCSAGVCPAVIGSTVPMRDIGHVTTTYAAQLAEPLREALRLQAPTTE